MKLIFTRGLAELMDKQQFQREALEELIAALGITMEIRTVKLLHKPTQLQLHQHIAVNWIAENENSLAKGSSLGDDCRTCKVRPRCAREIYSSPH